MNRTERRRLSKATIRRDDRLHMRFWLSCNALGIPGLVKPPRQFSRFFRQQITTPEAARSRKATFTA